jgi:hypothetical protein
MYKVITCIETILWRYMGSYSEYKELVVIRRVSVSLIIAEGANLYARVWDHERHISHISLFPDYPRFHIYIYDCHNIASVLSRDTHVGVNCYNWHAICDVFSNFYILDSYSCILLGLKKKWTLYVIRGDNSFLF